jgi:hypothetical protein
MEKQTCSQCNRDAHGSNLIGGMVCLHCAGKTLHNTKMMAKVFEFFVPIYKFTPIIAGLISLVYLIINPNPNWGLMLLLILASIVFLISFFGMLGSLSPNWNSAVIAERELQLKAHLKDYVLTTVSSCKIHAGREAVGRCSICFEPYCADDFIGLNNNPEVCRSCSSKAFMAEIALKAFIPAILSTGLLCGVGIYYNVINSGYYGFNIGFFAFFSIIFILERNLNHT